MKSLTTRIAQGSVLLGMLLPIVLIPGGVNAAPGNGQGQTPSPTATSFTPLPSAQRPNTHAPIVKPAGDKGRPAPPIPPRPAKSPQGNR